MTTQYVKYPSPTGTGTGTVTSVGLSDASSTAIYTVTGSPVTTSGTLTLTLKTETANLVFAGPNTGAAAQPTFRALVTADIPFPLLAPNGSAGAPSYSFSSDATTGVYFSATQINLAVGGTLRASLSTSLFTSTVNFIPSTDNNLQLGDQAHRWGVIYSPSIRSDVSSMLFQTGAGNTTALTIDTSQNATFAGTANFNKGIVQSGTTSIAISTTCTNNENILKQVGDAGGSSSTQITEWQSFYGTQKIATLQILNTNATAANSGGVFKVVTNDGTGTLTTGIIQDQNGKVTIGASGGSVAFYGGTPATKASAYTVSNATPSRSLNVSTVTLTQLANNVAQLIADLQSIGMVG